MAKYRCTKCGNMYDEKSIINPSPDVKDKVPADEKQAEKKCCPICGADQGEFCEVYEEAKSGRYD